MSHAVSCPAPVTDPDFGSWTTEPRLLHTRGSSVGKFGIRPGVRVRNHTHDGEALFVVLSGALSDRGKIGPRGGEVLQAGSLRVLPAGDRRDLSFGPEGAQCLVVEFEPALCREAGVTIRRRMVTRDPRLTHLAAGLQRHLDAPTSGRSLLLDLDVLELLAQFDRRQRRARLQEPPAWLRRVRQELEQSEAYPDLDRLGGEAGVHPLHLVRAFRDHYGCAMGAVVRRLRLVRAYRRIIDTIEPLSDVAAVTGFSDQSHMTREVRREFGAPPAHLRRVTPQR